MDHQAIDTYMSCFSALFKCHRSVDHFEVVEARICKFFHLKINLNGEHIHLFMLVNLASAGLRVKNKPPTMASIYSLVE
jgi:hypothetical protein